ncbi:MAG TPA: hypothetical protein VF524_04520 [Polyangia bacterium]
MSLASRSPTISDHLLLAGHVLRALENGRLRMHAGDYHEIAAWAAGELSRLATPELERFSRSVPGALQGIAENLLHERREPWWCGDFFAYPEARFACRAVLQNLRLPRTS